MRSTILFFFDSLLSTSSLVEYCPDLVFFGFSSIFNLSKRITPSCLGEEILNSSPEC